MSPNLVSPQSVASRPDLAQYRGLRMTDGRDLLRQDVRRIVSKRGRQRRFARLANINEGTFSQWLKTGDGLSESTTERVREIYRQTVTNPAVLDSSDVKMTPATRVVEPVNPTHRNGVGRAYNSARSESAKVGEHEAAPPAGPDVQAQIDKAASYRGALIYLFEICREIERLSIDANRTISHALEGIEVAGPRPPQPVGGPDVGTDTGRTPPPGAKTVKPSASPRKGRS